MNDKRKEELHAIFIKARNAKRDNEATELFLALVSAVDRMVEEGSTEKSAELIDLEGLD